MRCLSIRVAPQLTISVDPSAEAGIFGDAQRLSQVVSNLLRCSPRNPESAARWLTAPCSNASKFSAARTGAISCAVSLEPWSADGADALSLAGDLSLANGNGCDCGGWSLLPEATVAQLRKRLEECGVREPVWRCLRICVR
jgi:hypothetical protein